MSNNGNVIKIELCQRYVTRMISAADWEVRMLERIRYLRNRGHDTLNLKFDSSQAVVSPVCKENGQNGRNGV